MSKLVKIKDHNPTCALLTLILGRYYNFTNFIERCDKSLLGSIF